MGKVVDGTCRALEVLMALLMAVMLLLVFGNVVLRYAFGTGIVVSEELSRWMFVWMVFLGSVVAVRERAHLGTELVLERLPAPIRRASIAVAQALMVYISWLLFRGSYAQMQLNVDVHAQVSGISFMWLYLSGAVFAALSGLLLLLDLWRTVAGKFLASELHLSQGSEDLAQLDALRIDQAVDEGARK